MNLMKGLRAKNRRLALSAAKPNSNQRILDLGCGEGELTLSLAAGAKEVVGIDDRPFLGELEGKILPVKSVCFLQASLQGLPFEDETFDRIVSANAWHRFREREELLYEVLRVLKPAGEMILTDTCLEGLPFWRLWARTRGYQIVGFQEEKRFFGRYFPSVRMTRFLWGGMMVVAKKK
ncbi:MAG TPA: class I SAM-dependent methyltransferase [Chroococcales cyanobacterium]|jgi:ubiquinone/menaquinone biosynthesis C-methylase UbiE